MRLILENSRESEVPLEDDLSALELYMQLEALRFRNRFKYKIVVDPQIDRQSTLIPPMLLQPLVENSILHGVSPKEKGLIQIIIKKEGRMLRCSLEDNGVGRQESPMIESGVEEREHQSLGMKIIEERLLIINHLKKATAAKASVHFFDLKDKENKPRGLHIELLLPFETAF